MDIIASSRFLADLRAVNEKRLSPYAPPLAGQYDLVLIDCQPSYDNLTLNALNVADCVITPVLKDLDSFNAACLLQRKLSSETDKSSRWYITINGYNRRYEEDRGGKSLESLKTFTDCFPHTPRET